MDLIEPGLSESFSNELQSTSIDLGVDYAEVALDAFIKDGPLKDLPIINTVIGLGKIGLAFKDLHFTKKMVLFLKEFHTRGADPKKLHQFKTNIQNDVNYRNKVTTHILNLIDKMLLENKSLILARLLLAHINEEYDWETFVDLSCSLDSMLLIDFKVLGYLKQQTETVTIDEIKLNVDKYLIFASIERLRSIGFIARAGTTWDSLDNPFKETVVLSKFGKKFYALCLE